METQINAQQMVFSDGDLRPKRTPKQCGFSFFFVHDKTDLFDNVAAVIQQAEIREVTKDVPAGG